MRRPLIIIFLFILLFSFIKIKTGSYYQKEEDIKISGIVKQKIEKKMYVDYVVGDFLVRDYSKRFNLKVGKIINLSGKIKDLEKLSSEEFNYKNYIKSKGFKGLIYGKSYEITGVDKFYDKLNDVYLYIKSTSRYLYKENSDFINSLILGMKTDLSDEEKEMFKKTGTSHVIAISGMHIGILSSIIVFIFGKINKIYKLIIVIFVSVIYSKMIGESPSIIRAISFMSIFYFAYFIDKKSDGISNLALIGSVLIINNPYIIYSIGFILSFLATLSIVYFYKIVNKKIKNSFISLTLSANILTFPIVYYSFGNISFLSIFGNLVVTPFIGIIMYLSIISVFLFKINLFFCDIIVFINRFLINLIYYLLEKISEIKFLYFEFNNSSMNLVVIYYIFIFSYMIYREIKCVKYNDLDLKNEGKYKELQNMRVE